MRIQRLSTASYKFFSPQGKIVMVDPWLTGDPLWPLAERTPEKLQEIEAVAVTHAHFDHSAGIEEIVKHNESVFIIAQYEYALSLAARGIKNVIPAGIGATVEFQGIKFSMVSASHTSSEMVQEGKTEFAGTAVGYVIEFEDGKRVYVSGDTGLTADMKFVVSDFFKPQISILPVCGLFMMEPEQAAYAANAIGSRWVIPCHDFPKEVSDAADPEGYRKFLEQYPVQDLYKKVEKFMDIMKRAYPHIETVYIPIGGSASFDEPI
jgi:L-ascorbate metabolism protein UlaG (beta-lactamase superfamily)